MLESVSVTDWFKLLGGIFLFLGPGFCIITLVYHRSLKSLTHWFVLSLTVSACLWAVLLAWLKIANIHVDSLFIFIFFGSGWVIGAIHLGLNRAALDLHRFSIKPHEILTWVLALSSGLLITWALRHQVAGLGSDSYHHSLITQLIYDNGGLPANYQPATTQLITFSYHYGYHAVMAALMWLTGWGSRLLVLTSGALLVAFSSLSLALLTEEISQSPVAGIVACGFTGLVFVFPTYLLNWGRFPQLAALALLAVFLQMILALYKKGLKPVNLVYVALLALIAAGIATTHYRITIMAAMGIFTLLIFVKNGKYSIHQNIQFLKSISLMAVIAFIFFIPWAWSVYRSHQVGYTISLQDVTQAYYSISRLGTSITNYPTNIIVLIIILAGLIFGLYKKQWFMIWLSIWTALLLLFSGPLFLSGFMDRISVIVSLFFPAAIIIGWLAQQIYERIKPPYRVFEITVILAIFIWSGTALLNKNLIFPGYVRAEDLTAAQWIKANTPPDALFAENTYRFGFSSNFVIGIDAGYWLPLIADRQTVTLPMIFDIEKFRQPDGLRPLLDLYNLGADLTTQPAVDYLHKEQISYVYIGEKGGPINVDLLLISDHFSLVYQKDKVYVFRVEN